MTKIIAVYLSFEFNQVKSSFFCFLIMVGELSDRYIMGRLKGIFQRVTNFCEGLTQEHSLFSEGLSRNVWTLYSISIRGQSSKISLICLYPYSLEFLRPSTILFSLERSESSCLSLVLWVGYFKKIQKILKL